MFDALMLTDADLTPEEFSGTPALTDQKLTWAYFTAAFESSCQRNSLVSDALMLTDADLTPGNSLECLR